MRIPAPSFDYNSLATPGGVGQGLASIAGAVINARAMQNKAEAERQGLARLEQRDREDRMLRSAELDERARANKATENFRQQELGLRGLESFGRGAATVGKGIAGLFPDAKTAAQIDHLKSMAEKNRRPPAPRPAPVMSHEARVGYLKLLEQAKADLQAKAMTDPRYKPTKNWGGWGDDTPAERSLEQELKDLEQTHPAAIALREATANQQAPAPASAMPAAAGNLRARVSGLFGGAIPPDWEQSIMEAEAGDAEALQQLEEMLAEPGGAGTMNLGLDVGP